MTAYTVDLRIGSWSTTVTAGDEPDPAAPVVVDGLDASWSSDVDTWPSQPDPTTCTFGLFVRDGVARPDVDQGTPVALVLNAADYDPGDGSTTYVPPFFEFYGRISDPEAEPLNDGLAFRLTCVAYTADLGEERVGMPPWRVEDYERWYHRWNRICDASALNLVPLDAADLDANGPYAPLLGARDADATPTADLIEEVLRDGANWRQAGGYVTDPHDPQRGPYARWERPIVTQVVDDVEAAEPAVSFAVGMIRQGTFPDVTGLPYLLGRDAANLIELVRKPGMLPAQDDLVDPAGSTDAAWVPADAVERKVTWRQDKAQATNRTRLTGTFIDYSQTGSPTVSEVSREFPDQVAARGPVESASPSNASTAQDAYAVALMYLGEEYDALPRFTFDEVIVLPERIPDSRYWPRLFPRADGAGRPAAGRFFLLTDIPAAWNLHHRPDFPGRVVGANLNLNRGRIRVTARVVHHVPTPNGPGGEINANGLRDTRVGDPTALDFGPTAPTFVDMRLVDKYPDPAQ